MDFARGTGGDSVFPRLTIGWARHADEVAEAQRLRWRVFAEEQKASIASPIPGLDIDSFDAHCEHLIVRNERTGEVVGTYRVLTGVVARRLGGFYSDQEFDLSRLDRLRDQAVEIGRSCVHPAHRNGATIALLWSGLAGLMMRGPYDIMIGCASIPVTDGGHAAASIYARAARTSLSADEHRVFPRNPLPLQELDASRAAVPPALIKAYLRSGAFICGAPHWDREFNTADLLMMLQLSRLEARYAQHFLKTSTGRQAA